MQERNLFEYAVIRVVPRVERQEFMNVGIIVYCAAHKFLQTVYYLDEERLLALCDKLNLGELKERLSAFEKICAGGADAGPIGKLPLASRFRWLTASRSTIVQTSPVHSGFCSDAATALANLHEELVK